MGISLRYTPSRLLLMGGLLLCMAHTASAEIFKYADRNGNLLFTDTPVQGAYKLLWRSSGRKTSPWVQRKGWVDQHLFEENYLRFSPMIEETAQRTRLYPELLHAVVRAESYYDPNAVSRAGAVGLMQLMPATASRYGVVDPRDPKANLDAGARYLRDLLTRYRNNIKLALAAYNAGEGAVHKYGNTIPPYPETRKYVTKVLAFYRQYRKNKRHLTN